MGRISIDEFLQAVSPALEAGDTDALFEAVNGRWSNQDLCCLLRHRESEIRSVAVLVLGVAGDRSIVGCLTRCLHDPAAEVSRFAEDALWSIWLRSGKPEATLHFHAAMQALASDRFEEAIEGFHRAIEIDPDFAEAYNQLSIVHYLRHDWRASMSACRQTLALMPTHFGALAGLGHIHAHLHELRQAVDCYRRALAINPHMHCIAEAKADLEKQLSDADAASLPSTQMVSFEQSRPHLR